MTDKKVWLITGAGRGLGVHIVKAALAAGHAVVASGRDPGKVAAAVGDHPNLLAVKLESTTGVLPGRFCLTPVEHVQRTTGIGRRSRSTSVRFGRSRRAATGRSATVWRGSLSGLTVDRRHRSHHNRACVVERTNLLNGNHMMLPRRRVLLASAALLSTPWTALATTSRSILQLEVEYTATSLIGTAERAVPGRLWRTYVALRHEGRQHGSSLTVIARLDRNICWLVMAESSFSIVTDLSALDLPLDVLKGGGDMRQIREGRERVNGLDTMRVRVERNAGWGTSFTGHIWATDQGVIARLAGEGESRGRRGRTLMNFRDVQIGPLDPALFEAPRGVQFVEVKGADLATLLEGMEAAGQIWHRR
jgi:hypothetical protein